MALTPQTQHPFLKGTLFQSPFRRRKDTWCDMTHNVVVYYQAWVRWMLCNDIIPKAIPPSSMTCSMSSFGKTCQHHQTDQARKNTPAVIHTWLSLKDKGQVDELALTTHSHAITLTSTPSDHQHSPNFIPLLTLTKNSLPSTHGTRLPTSL